MLRISKAERAFIQGGVDAGVRGDGRGRLDYRFVSVDTGLLPQANGSARVTLVNASTDVLGAVKAELAEPAADTPDQGRIECSVVCWSSASPEFERRGADEINSQLSATLSRIISSSGAIDLKSLCVIPGKMCWVLYVDVLVLDSGGSIMDAVSLAAYAALHDTQLPRLYVVPGETEEEADVEVDEDPDAAVSLAVEALPVCITFFQIGGKTVVDARQEEEVCANARVMVAVNRAGKVCAAETSGRGGVAPAVLHAALEAARQVAARLIERVDAALGQSAAKDVEVAGGAARSSRIGGAGVGKLGDSDMGEDDVAGVGGTGASSGADEDLPPLDMERVTKLLEETAIERSAALKDAARREQSGFLAS